MCLDEDTEVPVTFEAALKLAEEKLPELNRSLEEAQEARDNALRGDSPGDTSLEELEEDVRDAQAAFDEVAAVALTTIKDYNLFRVPRIMQQFHLPTSFADSYSQLCDLRHWSPAKAEELKRSERRATMAAAGLTTASDKAMSEALRSLSQSGSGE